MDEPRFGLDYRSKGILGAMGPAGFVLSCPVWGMLLGNTEKQVRVMMPSLVPPYRLYTYY
jgi:hypothetical protein